MQLLITIHGGGEQLCPLRHPWAQILLVSQEEEPFLSSLSSHANKTSKPQATLKQVLHKNRQNNILPFNTIKIANNSYK